MKYSEINFRFQNWSFLARYLIRVEKAKNEQLVNDINDWFIDLRNAITKKENRANENRNKIVDIVEKILDFHK